MTPAWHAEARGAIEPWTGAIVIRDTIYRDVVTAIKADPSGALCVRATGDLSPVPIAEVLLDLENPDTLAAFDRRLALRLGAPTLATQSGVVIRLDTGHGDGLNLHIRTGDGTWGCQVVLGLAEPDAILARVRAWRSVPG